MMCRLSAASMMCLGLALALASNQAFGEPGAVLRDGVAPSMRSTFHSLADRSADRRIGRNPGTFFPATGGFFAGPSYGRPYVEVMQPISGDMTYTYKYDVPWDWAHRYPPSYFEPPPPPPSPPGAYQPGCPTQAVTVPGADGKDQTLAIVRC